MWLREASLMLAVQAELVLLALVAPTLARVRSTRPQGHRVCQQIDVAVSELHVGEEMAGPGLALPMG